MKTYQRYFCMAAGTLMVLCSPIATGGTLKCADSEGKVLYGSDCPAGSMEKPTRKGTVSVGDSYKGKPSPKSGPSISSMEDSRAKEKKLDPVQKRTDGQVGDLK